MIWSRSHRMPDATPGINWSVQRGEEPFDWKPMSSIGAGVKEIRIRDGSGEFRMVYLASRPEGIYVLHCFQKKAGKTARQDAQLARSRFKAIANSLERR